MSWKERIDRFPTQLTLTVAFGIIGAVATVALARTWYERMLLGISFYAIVATHFTGHLAWRSKRAAEAADEQTDPPGS